MIPGQSLFLFFDCMKILFDLRAGNLRRTRQINNLTAFFLKKIKLSFPVISHDKRIYMIFFYIGTLLLPVFFRNHKIHISNCLQKLFSFFVGKITFLLLFVPVELVCRKTNDQIISKLSGTTQKINMSIMKQIKSSVCITRLML